MTNRDGSEKNNNRSEYHSEVEHIPAVNPIVPQGCDTRFAVLFQFSGNFART